MGGISAIGAAHVAMGSVALVSGAVVLMLPKGTAQHRRVGKIYAATILAINATALSMYDLTGRPNVFHVIALVNLIAFLVIVLRGCQFNYSTLSFLRNVSPSSAIFFTKIVP